MNIAIDYDNTITADESLWHDFIAMCGKRHKVYIVTMRYGKPRDLSSLLARFDPSEVTWIYTCRMAKKDFCKNRGIKIDIWIDDNPHSILFHHWSLTVPN